MTHIPTLLFSVLFLFLVPSVVASPQNAMRTEAQQKTLVAGVDYQIIKGGRPYQPVLGKVEVVEVFGYGCPACANFDPLVSAWEKKLPDDVNFVLVPAPFGENWIPYAQAYYVADSLGLVDKTHSALFDAIHLKRSLPGHNEKPSSQAIADFYAQYGADPEKFASTMESFAINAKVKRGAQFIEREGVSATPTIIVNGKYRVQGKSYSDVLRITSHLVAQERSAQ